MAVNPAGTLSIPEGEYPNYVFIDAPFEVILWHELVGHNIKKKGHPTMKWNSYEHVDDDPKKPNTKVDPTIEIENQARKALNLKPRRPQYWNDDAGMEEQQLKWRKRHKLD